MVGMNSRNAKNCKLEYVGMTGTDENHKSQLAKSGFSFDPGDSLRLIGYAKTPDGNAGSDVFFDAPETSQDYTFKILEGTPCPNVPIVNYDGQLYKTVLIDSQCWFKENLNVGTRIEGVQAMQNNGQIEKYCYDNKVTNCDVYGGLYQWNEIMNYSTQQGVQGICPEGWHIPTQSELTSLVAAMGGQGLAGGKLKETGTWHWLSPNTGATNESGFTFYGSGFRFSDGTFDAINHFAGIWTSTQNPAGAGTWGRVMMCDNTTMPQYSYNKILGFNVRCLKNE
jgi:uncharacterized protein (TIGR02145 family)